MSIEPNIFFQAENGIRDDLVTGVQTCALPICVKFTTVVLSLAYDNFGDAGAPATIPATVRILRGSGPIQTLNVNIEVGRKFFHFMHADDQAASVQLNPPAGFRPQVSAMVEYTTP